MNKKTVATSLICPDCGNIFPIMRKVNKQKSLFHRKYLYCPMCKKVTNHIEAKDLEKLLFILDNTTEEEKTEDEKKVYQLLRKRGD